MELFFDLLLVFLLICTVAVSLSRHLLNSRIIYMSFSLIMSVGITGSGDHRGSSRCGRYIDFIYYYLKENPCDLKKRFRAGKERGGAS